MSAVAGRIENTVGVICVSIGSLHLNAADRTAEVRVVSAVCLNGDPAGPQVLHADCATTAESGRASTGGDIPVSGKNPTGAQSVRLGRSSCAGGIACVERQSRIDGDIDD